MRGAAALDQLRVAYPNAHCALDYDTPFQLLVATILSAQCTDVRVNLVTPALFAEYPTPGAMATAPIDRVEVLIRPTGFFRQKAKNIVATSQRILVEHGGTMPETVDELRHMPGAARKTANVVVADCFPDNIDGIAVDTHVQRVARRLALTRSWEPERVERDLMRDLPRSTWREVTHLLIELGRMVCSARKPRCSECPIAHLCPSAGRFAERS